MVRGLDIFNEYFAGFEGRHQECGKTDSRRIATNGH